jgi:hypothetical protein
MVILRTASRLIPERISILDSAGSPAEILQGKSAEEGLRMTNKCRRLLQRTAVRGHQQDPSKMETTARAGLAVSSECNAATIRI